MLYIFYVIDRNVYKLNLRPQKPTRHVILLIIWMLNYNKQCYDGIIQDYLIVYPQLDGSIPPTQMVNKPFSILDNFEIVHKQSAENIEVNNATGRSNTQTNVNNDTLVPVSVTGIVSNNTPVSGSFSGTPDAVSNTVVKGEVQAMATTVFVDNAETVQKDESTIAHVDPSWFKINDTQATEQSIKDFLAKPVVLLNSNFNISDTLTSIYTMEMPFYVWDQTLWTEKLRGYFGMRMDMRFRLVVNANRFQQGRYIMGWVPLGGMGPSATNTKSENFRKAHMATLVQRTTIPHVELDISTTTSAELLVPFASVHNFYPLNAMTVAAGSYNSTLGFLQICPYSPLVSPAGGNTASFTVYVSFENVTLFGAASPQSLAREGEISNKMSGPISGIASAFARGFTEISDVPFLSSYAKGAAWISDRIARTANIFGFSKPTEGDSMQKVMILNNPGHCNVDGDAGVRTLSYLAKPSTIPLDGMSGTKFDEMDFSYITRKFAWLATTPWSTGTSGDFYSLSVLPLAFRDLGGARHFLPVGFVANFFGLWRGSIKIRIKFVKTEFHSGRLMIVFFPTDEIASNLAKPEYVNRHIIDIREFNEFTFEIPYISRYTWLPMDQRVGVLAFRVVDQLVAPTSVSNTVQILVEIAGGDDLQFSVPSQTDYRPIEFTPQSGASGPNAITMNIGNTQTMGDPVAASALTIGDKVTSFRSLLKRYYYLVPSSRLAANTTTRLNTLQISINPDLIPIVPLLLPATDTVVCDVIGMVASCYTFWGGGIRFKDVLSVGLTATPLNILQSNNVQVSFEPLFYTSGEGVMWYELASPSTQTYSQTHQIIQSVYQNNTLSFELPQYSRSLKRCIPDAWISYTTGVDHISYRPNLTQGRVRIGLPAGLGAVTPVNDYDLHNIYRSLADDGEFSLFISIPPMQTFACSARYHYY